MLLKSFIIYWEQCKHHQGRSINVKHCIHTVTSWGFDKFGSLYGDVKEKEGSNEVEKKILLLNPSTASKEFWSYRQKGSLRATCEPNTFSCCPRGWWHSHTYVKLSLGLTWTWLFFFFAVELVNAAGKFTTVVFSFPSAWRPPFILCRTDCPVIAVKGPWQVYPFILGIKSKIMNPARNVPNLSLKKKMCMGQSLWSVCSIYGNK